MAYCAYANEDVAASARPIDRLLAAAIRGDHHTVRQCLRQPDVPVDLPLSDWGSTPLQCAVEKGQAEVCRLLLARRADVRVQDAFGDTCLHRAAHHGHDEVARVLLEGGAPVDLKNELGQTALHVAAMKVSFLTQFGELVGFASAKLYSGGQKFCITPNFLKKFHFLVELNKVLAFQAKLWHRNIRRVTETMRRSCDKPLCTDELVVARGDNMRK